MRKFNFVKIALLCFFTVTLIACTTLNTKVGGLLNLDTDLALTLFADSDINPDDNKIPSPLFVRLYELKTTKMFDKANFIDLYENDAEALGADMITKQRLKHIRPGEQREVNFVLNDETRYVGLYAEFLNYKSAGFKLVVPVARTNVISSSATIQISGNRLVLKE